MTLEDLHSYYVTYYKMAKALDVSPNLYLYWKSQNRIPYHIQLKAEIESMGRLKADRWSDTELYSGFEEKAREYRELIGE